MVQIKIYPSKYNGIGPDGISLSPSGHKIQLINESTFDTDLNIPLTYINLDYTKYEIKKDFNLDFQKADTNKNIKMTPILPKQVIDNVDKFTFNKFEEQVDPSDYYKEFNGKKYYTPYYEFVPNNFSYEVTIKKNMVYNSSNRYNINIGCLDDPDSLDLSSRMSKIFTNPSDRQLIPQGISINENRENLTAFIDKAYDDLDFLFVESFDGNYLDKEKTEELNIGKFLDSNVNVWVSCDEHHLYKNKNDELGYLTFNVSGAYNEFEFKRTNLSKTRKVTSNYYFNMNRSELSSTTNKLFYNIFTNPLSPVLIIEHVGRGFEIISHSEILKNPEKNKELIYEVMMYVYLISYKKSRRVSEWISYTCPDYEVVNNQLYEKTCFSSHITLNELFNITSGDYSIFQIDVFDNNKELPVPNEDLVNIIDNIKFVNVVNNRLVFKMDNKDQNNIYTEVDKPVGWISIYKDGKIYYVDQLLYYIESDISNKVFIIEKDNSLIVKLYPFKSSKYNINLKVDKQLTIPNIKTDVNGKTRIINETYTIYYDLKNDNIAYCYNSNFDSTNVFHVKLLDIYIFQSIDKVFLTDMRQLGGGLRSDAKADYDLMDIGHINGRPYRKTNTLVITMPKKYESHKQQILEALDKYKIGESYSVVFFEDEEDEE